MSSIHDIKYLYENSVYVEGAAAEHPDIAGQKEFASKADAEIARRKAARAKKAGPQLPSFVGKMKKEEFEIDEKIDVGADVGATISDFVHSKSKIFKGDSKKQRINRALGAYYAAKRAQKEEVEVTEEIENLEEKARGTKPKRTVHAYDVDETLFSHGKKGKPNVQVHVKDASGKRVQSLSNQEFNTHKLQKGHSYDFSEFQSAKKFGETSSPNKKVIKHLQKKVKRGENVHLITARSKFDDPKEFHGHLKKHGIDVPLHNIHYTGGMKGGDIGNKKVAVANAIAKQSGTKNIHMYDDAAKVHKSFEKEKQEHPTTKKIKTHLVKPNKEGTPVSRSYQATKEELLIKFPGKENIQNENMELSPYEYWNTYIRENKVESQVIEEQAQEVITEEEKDFGSYSYWKSILQEETK